MQTGSFVKGDPRSGEVAEAEVEAGIDACVVGAEDRKEDGRQSKVASASQGPLYRFPHTRRDS